MARDEIICCLLEGGQARAYVAQTTGVVRDAMAAHGLSYTAAAALGRALTCGAIMGAQLKNDNDRLSITIKGGGPLGAITVAAKKNGGVKGYVDNPLCDLPPKSNGKLDVGGAVGKNGRMTVIRDMGLKEPYVGNSPLVSGEIGDDFAYYFATSEQQPCAVALGVLLEGGAVKSAGGVILQPLPGCSEEVLQYLERSSALLSEVSQLFYDNSATDVANVLFWRIDHTFEASFPAKYACDCTKSRIESVIISLGREEIADMIEKQNGANIKCQFCNKEYSLSAQELRKLMESA